MTSADPGPDDGAACWDDSAVKGSALFTPGPRRAERASRSLAPATGHRPAAGSVPTQIAVLTARSLRTAPVQRTLLAPGLLLPLVALVLLSQVFAGVGALPEVAGAGGYTGFLVPAALVAVALAAAVSSGAGLRAEIRDGLAGRFRTLPVAPLAVLAARSAADTLRLAGQLLVVVAIAVVVLGARPAGGVLGLLGAVAVAAVVGWGLGWVSLAVATTTDRAVPFVAVLPLAVFSSAVMPQASVEPWVRLLATVNPLTYAVDAVRGLALGRPDATVAIVAVAVAVGAGAAMVATRALRRRWS